MLELNRSAGILLHISSLPSKYGIGDMGEEAYRWVDFLDRSGIQYWQMLPLNPTGYSHSPYQGLSAFAGNPLFIDLEALAQIGLLEPKELSKHPHFSSKRVEFEKVITWKSELLRCSFENYLTKTPSDYKDAFTSFKQENHHWLEDFALFMTIREKYKKANWNEWPDEYRLRKKKALEEFSRTYAKEIEFHQFSQFLFASQIDKLKKYANSKGIALIGDIPIFMGYNSADVWAYPQLFDLDKNLNPVAIAGVPPDFFSENGQLWGNPLYKWRVHKKDGYSWWIKRVKETLKTVDLIRLDHFRGFAGYFRIPAGSKTAATGKWVHGPGADLFDTIKEQITKLPFIAEDLGVITPDVIALRDKYDLPGMRLIQFGFSKDADDEYLPHNYPENCVAYTGTHDNDTTASWFKHAEPKVKNFCNSYLGGHTKSISHEMIRTIWQSKASIAIAPMQDFLQLGGWARMNSPATTEGNWVWRMRRGEATMRLSDWIKEINITFGRTANGKDWPASDHFS